MARRVDASAVILRRETSHFSRTHKHCMWADQFDIIKGDDEARVTRAIRQERGTAGRIHGGPIALVYARRPCSSRPCRRRRRRRRCLTYLTARARRSTEPLDELDDDVAVLHAASVGRLRLPAAHDGVRSSVTGDSRAMMKNKVRRDASFKATATDAGVFASLVVHLPVPHLARRVLVLVLEHRTSEASWWVRRIFVEDRTAAPR
jgi:hypothetical protein